MRFQLTLTPSAGHGLLPVNYQYPLSAAIYKIIQQADEKYSAFLHDTGYKLSNGKSFKLFSFSDLKAPYQIQDDRMLLLSPEAGLQVCFHLPQTAETFIKGLFMSQQIEIADRISGAAFTVTGVEALPDGLSNESVQEILLQPLSPVVCGKKNERGNYDFLSPEHPEFVFQSIYNWKEKYGAIYGEEKATTAFADVQMEVLFYKNPPKSKLITIKAGTNAETKIRGFINFQLKVKAPKEALELLLNSGIGLYNAQGMGCVEITKSVHAS